MARNPGVLRNMRVKRVAIVDAGANFDKQTGDGAHIMLFKRDTRKDSPTVGVVHVDAPLGGEDDEKKKEKPVKKSWMRKMFAAITETDVTKRETALTELEKEFPDQDDTMHKADDATCKCADCMAKRVSKSADVIALEKRLSDQAAEIEKSNKRADDLQKAMDVEVEKRLDAEMVEILKEFKATPFDMTKDVAVYRKMKKDAPEAFARTIEIMKAADAQLAAGVLMKDIGTRRGTGEGSAWAQLEALAEKLVEKSGDKLTTEQALEKVMLDPKNNKLVREYRNAQQ